MNPSCLLQNWTTVQLAASGSIVQSSSDWIDASAFSDVAIYTSTKQVTAAVGATIHIETSPSRDDELFRTMTDGSIAMNPTENRMSFVKYQLSTTTEPLARWVRWRYTSTAASVCCFRVWLRFNAQASLMK